MDEEHDELFDYVQKVMKEDKNMDVEKIKSTLKTVANSIDKMCDDNDVHYYFVIEKDENCVIGYTMDELILSRALYELVCKCPNILLNMFVHSRISDKNTASEASKLEDISGDLE